MKGQQGFPVCTRDSGALFLAGPFDFAKLINCTFLSLLQIMQLSGNDANMMVS